MNTVKKCPLPISGLILAIFALGNLVQSINPIFKTILGIIGGILYLLFIFKVLLDFDFVKQEMQKTPVASVVPTITMATMLIATYVKPISDSLAKVFWWAGVIGHILLILYFTAKFVTGFKIKTVFPSWYIVYVGIAVAGVTAPAVGQLGLGQMSFWFGLVTFAILVPIVLYRVWKVKEMPPPTMPSLVILSAPASLLLAAYMNSFPEKNMTMVWLLVALSVIFFVIGLYYLIKLITNKFIPTMSGFTFPMVISAVAMAATNGFLTKAGTPNSLINLLAKAQLVIAVVVVLYVLFGYITFLLKKPQA